jgi:hypothetical protein
MFYPNYLAMRNTADVVVSPSPSDGSLSQDAVNPLVAFYDDGRKGEVLFFCSVPDTTRGENSICFIRTSIYMCLNGRVNF